MELPAVNKQYGICNCPPENMFSDVQAKGVLRLLARSLVERSSLLDMDEMEEAGLLINEALLALETGAMINEESENDTKL